MSKSDKSKKGSADQSEDAGVTPEVTDLNADDAVDTSTDQPSETPSQDTGSVGEDSIDAAAEVADNPMDEDATVTDADTTSDTDTEIDSGPGDDSAGDDSLDSEGIVEVTNPEGPTEPPQEPEPKVIEKQVIERKGGFVPMVLGGVAAGIIGVLAVPSLQGVFPGLAPAPDPAIAENQAAVAAQETNLAALEGRLGEVAASVDAIGIDAVRSDMEAMSTRLDEIQGAFAGLSEQVTGYDSRMTELEKQPLNASVSPEAIAAYERELASMRETLEAQRAEVETMAADAVAAEQNALVQAASAQGRAALARLTAQMQNGEPYVAQLEELRLAGFDAPAALTTPAADGVATLIALAADFPDLARNALAAARSEAGAGSDEGVRSFFQRQLGARSVTPRDGDDPDAVLSRTEASVNAGELGMAVSEISKLPASAQAELADWVARVETRLAALGAVESLALELNQE